MSYYALRSHCDYLYLGKGSLRCDVNVSLHRAGEPWGARVEVKNVNKIKSGNTMLLMQVLMS